MLGNTINKNCPVASRADAWIETKEFSWFKPIKMVASRADAWIETLYVGSGIADSAGSRPARTRGLKLPVVQAGVSCRVASRADAWIETVSPDMHSMAPRRVPRGRVD